MSPASPEPEAGPLGRADSLKFLDGLDDDFDPFTSDGPSKASRAQQQREEEEEDQGEEIKLTHETGNAAARATEDIAVHFETLQAQVSEFKERYDKAKGDLLNLQSKTSELEDELENLREENTQLSYENQNAGGKGGIALIGGRAGGGKAMKGRGGMAKALLSVTEEMDVDVVEDIDDGDSLWHRLRVWWMRNKPLQHEYRRVSSRFGAAATTYFFFYRFVFLQFSLMAIISIAFSAIHVSRMLSRGLGYNDIMGRTGGAFLPNFMLYSTYNTNEGFEYSLMVAIGIMTLIVSVIQHLVSEDKSMKEVEVHEVGNESPFAREVFCAWDCSMTEQQEADDQYQALGSKYIFMLDEEATKGKQLSRTRMQLVILWTRRFLGFCGYLGIQAAAFVAIIILTINTDAITQSLVGTPFAVFSASLSPIALQAINGLVPTFIKKITVFEAWDTGGVHTSLLLLRMYLFNILNTLILAISYVLLADPFLLADRPQIRNSLVLPPVVGFSCLIDQTAAALFSLVVTTFLLKELLNNFLLPLITTGATQYLLGKSPPKDPFELVDSTIDTIGFVSNMLLTFPFAPLSLLFGPIMIYIRIKREIWVLMNFRAKPEKPWKAHYGGVIFTSVYLVTLVLVGLPCAVYFLTTKTFPKDCSIQDNYVGMCTTEINPATGTCTVDSTSVYYSSYGKDPYPATICQSACGAFVDSRSNFAPFKEMVLYVAPTEIIWDALFTYPYLPWAALMFFSVQRALRKNSRDISIELHEKESRLLHSKVELLEKEKKRIEKSNQRLQLQLQDIGVKTGEEDE